MNFWSLSSYSIHVEFVWIDSYSDVHSHLPWPQGKLYAIRDLDYEESVQYVLTVLAMDNPDNEDDTLSNTTQVNIN